MDISAFQWAWADVVEFNPSLTENQLKPVFDIVYKEFNENKFNTMNDINNRFGELIDEMIYKKK